MYVYVIFNAEGQMLEVCKDRRGALYWFWTECDGEFTIKINCEEEIITSANGEEYKLVEWHTYS